MTVTAETVQNLEAEAKSAEESAIRAYATWADAYAKLLKGEVSVEIEQDSLTAMRLADEAKGRAEHAFKKARLMYAMSLAND